MTELNTEIVAGFEQWLKLVRLDGFHPDAYGHRRCGYAGKDLAPGGRCPKCEEVCPHVGGEGSEARP